jgi:hypothetical protein
MEAMMMRVALLACVILSFFAQPSPAEPLFGVMGGPPGSEELSPVFEVGLDQQFDVVVLLDTDGNEHAAAEFVMTELLLIAPGVFKLKTITNGYDGFPIEDRSRGEYVIAYQSCVPPASGFELVRVTYGTFAGPVPRDTVISVRGFQPGDSIPSTFGGRPGIVDCDDTLLPGSMGGHDGGFTETGVEVTDGSLGLNLIQPVVATEAGSLGALKCRY